MATAGINATKFDEMAKQYLVAKQKKESADKELADLRDKLLPLITRHGYVPAKAKKSKRVEGEIYDVTASFGESVEIDDALAEKFFDACSSSAIKAVREFADKVFSWRVTYKLQEDAHQLMAADLPKGSPRRLRRLFNQAVDVEPRTPTIKVEERAKANKAAA